MSYVQQALRPYQEAINEQAERIRILTAERNKLIKALCELSNLVDAIAGDQHDEASIDEAFGVKGLGWRISQAREAIRKAEGRDAS